MKKTEKRWSLFSLTWPLFIEILLYMLMGNADTLMLSLYSDKAVAAVGVSNQILSLVIVMFGFVATGTSILVAQSLGAKNRRSAAEVAAVSIGANLIFGLLLSCVAYFFGGHILRLMDLPAELMDQAQIFLKIVGGFSFIQALIMTIGAIIRSYGYTRDSMFVAIGMNILNVCGNTMFIFGLLGFPVLGPEGVAISTTVSRFIGLIAAVWILFKRVPGPFPFKMMFLFPKEHIRNLLKIGIPSAGEHLSYNGSQMVITFFITMLGTEALTTKVYTQNIMMFIYLASIAISQGTEIIIGHMIGGKSYEAAYQRCMKSLRLAILISFSAALVFSLFSHQLVGLFTANKEIITLGSTLILLTMLLEPGRSFNLVIINSLRAAGDVRFPVYMGILSMWGVSVGLSYILGIHFGFGLIGIWIAFICDEWLRGLLMLWRWKSRVWVDKSFVVGENGEAVLEA